MKKYKKIQSVYKRDPDNNYKTFLEGQFSKPAFKVLKDLKWQWDEKIDGTNIRIMWDGNTVIFGGRTDNAQIPTHLFQSLQEMFFGVEELEKFKEKFGDEGGVCLYGEGYGAKIQKGGGNYIEDDQSFVLFDVKIGDWWLKREDVIEIGDYFNVDVAPVIGSGTLEEMVEYTRNGFKSQWGDFEAEGIVARPPVQLFDRQGERIITKVKCKDFKEE